MDVIETKQQKMKDGTETKALYVKHLSKGDWEIIAQLQANQGGSDTVSVADVVRWSIRKASGRI